MFFVPAWVTNVLLLITICLAGFQHVRLRRPNPVTNIQFVVMIVGMVMVLVVAFFNSENAWVSLAFLAVAIGVLALTLRQQRVLPPMERL
jgi:Ca2+/Na+ antiporter